MPLTQELTSVHDHYRNAVNAAVARDDYPLVEELASAHGEESIRLIIDQCALGALPMRPPTTVHSPLRRLLGRFRARRAA